MGQAPQALLQSLLGFLSLLTYLGVSVNERISAFEKRQKLVRYMSGRREDRRASSPAAIMITKSPPSKQSKVSFMFYSDQFEILVLDFTPISF